LLKKVEDTTCHLNIVSLVVSYSPTFALLMCHSCLLMISV